MLSFAGCSQPSQGGLGGPASQLGAGFTKMSISSQSTQPGGSGATQGEKPPVPLFAEGPPVSAQLPLPPAAPAHGAHAPPPLEIPLSQQDFLGTQDFITPVDQFNLDYDPKDAKRSPARLTPNRVKRPRPGASSGGSSAGAGAAAGAGVAGDCMRQPPWAGPPAARAPPRRQLPTAAACRMLPAASAAAHPCPPPSHPPSPDASMDDADVTEPRGGFAGPSGRGGGGYGAAAPRRIARLQSPPCYRNIFAEGDSEEAYAPWKAPRPAAQGLTRYRCGRGGGGCRCGPRGGATRARQQGGRPHALCAASHPACRLACASVLPAATA